LRTHGFELIDHSVPVTTLAHVCDRHVRQTIDFLKIDVEGYEREVLEGADWSRFRPRIVVIEATRPSTSVPAHEEWEPILLAADYLFAFFDGLNRYYVRAEDKHLIPTLGVPANVFDQYEIHEHHQKLEQLHHALANAQTELIRNQLANRQAGEAIVALRQELDQSRLDHHRLDQQNAQTLVHLAAAHEQLAMIQIQLAETREQLAPFQDLGPIAIQLARRVRSMSQQSPRIAAVAKRLLRRLHPLALQLPSKA
jgi:hypothetical protein